MKYKISVIIPVYNGEKHICNIINKLKNKKDIEVIIVNDGSTDNTENIIKKYKNNNIKYIPIEKNNGISNARNKGLENINGKYFTFIDADDNIEDNMLEILYNEAENNNLDICCCNYNEIINDKIINSKYTYDNSIYSNKQLLKKVFTDKISTVAWGKLYRSSKYKKIRFNTNLLINEDYEYVIRCFNFTKRAKLLNNYLYKYIKNTSSITSNIKCNDVKNNNYFEYIKDLKLEKYKEFNFYNNINELRNIHLYSKCIDKNNIYKYLKNEINKNKLKKLLKENIPLYNKVEIIIFLISIRLHLLLFPIYVNIKNKIR